MPPEVRATTRVVLATSKRCPKCGTIKKSGKHSCCARGGAWFKSCGDVGSTKFDHTWVEGIQTCKNRTRWVSVEAPEQARHERIITQSMSITEKRIGIGQDADIHSIGHMSDDVEKTDWEARVELTKITVLASLLLNQ